MESSSGPLPPWEATAQAAQRQLSRVSSALGQARAACEEHLGRLAQSASAQLQHLPPPSLRGSGSRLPFASAAMSASPPSAAGDGADGGGRKKGRSYTPEEAAKARELIAGMTLEERKRLEAATWEQLLKSRKVKVDGEKKDLWALAKEVAEEDARRGSGQDEWRHKDTPAWQRLDDVRSDEIRLGAEKPMLFPEEQAALGLSRFGVGVLWSKHALPWLGRALGKRDVVFGVYAKEDGAREQLAEEWAGRNPDHVLAGQRFYDWVLATAPQTQLTLLAVPVRDLPLDEARTALTGALRARLAALPGCTGEDEGALERLAKTFTEVRLAESGLLRDGAGAGGAGRARLRQGSVFIFTTCPDGNLAAEAITAGTLREQARVALGTYRSGRLSYALFDALLGDAPADPVLKAAVGNNMLYAANGFTFGPNPNNPRQVPVADLERPWAAPEAVEEVELTPERFAYAPASRRPLLRGVRGAAKIKAHALADSPQ